MAAHARPVPYFWTAGRAANDGQALLDEALAALRCKDLAGALVLASFAARRYPGEAAPALLCAHILHSGGADAAKAYEAAWARAPDDEALQDALLRGWLAQGHGAAARRLGQVFLPARCKAGRAAALLKLLSACGSEVAGAVWRRGQGIAGELHDLQGGTAPLVLRLEHEDHRLRVEVRSGERFHVECPAGGEWSVSVARAGAVPYVLGGSPVGLPQRELPAPVFAAAPGVDIVIPVHGGFAAAQACIASVMASLPLNQTLAEIVVVDDASPDARLAAWLDALAAQGRIRLLRNAVNLGFIGAVNRALRRAGGRDVMLLNSDTLVHGDWLDRLARSLHAAPDIAAVTPWSNNGEVSSFPFAGAPAPMPTASHAAALDRLAALLRARGGLQDVELPACCGFAMLMRGAALARVGLFDGVLLARGYGEEVDWCMRARAAGYRHLLATGVYVAHAGGLSFGAEKTYRARHNMAAVARRHADYPLLYRQFLQDDPAAPARAALAGMAAKVALALHGEAPARTALPALPAAVPRVAVWRLRMGEPGAAQVLALARLLAGSALGLRLLVVGEASDALWHTGVVDVLPEGAVDDDLDVLELAGCAEVLCPPAAAWPGRQPLTRIGAGFSPPAWLAGWRARREAAGSGITLLEDSVEAAP